MTCDERTMEITPNRVKLTATVHWMLELTIFLISIARDGMLGPAGGILRVQITCEVSRVMN